MGKKYASLEMVDRVERLLRERFSKDEVVRPHTIELRSKNWEGGYIDHNQAEAALEILAPEPGQRVPLGDSNLIRSTAIRHLSLLRPSDRLPKEWWYDGPACNYFPVFPLAHQFLARNCPLIHDFIFGSRDP